MDIFSALKMDHLQVSELLEKLDRTSAGSVKTREQLFTQLKQALLAHAKVEEAVFYATLKNDKEAYANVLEAMTEHHVIELLLGELDVMPKGGDQWKAKLVFLKEAIEHHVKEEEGEVFRKARKIIDKNAAKRLGDLMLEREQTFKEAVEPVA